MDPLKLINNQIIKEKACIDDLIKEVAMHTQNERYQLASERGRDMQNSIMIIQQLERQKQLYIAATEVFMNGNETGIVNQLIGG
ncbi:hypothetical protein ACMGD3_22065 [Lysinibacillus sphaericus]|uniref:hypothetical protein n=1 Tax=Lysinibacillus sphaericus TaxID=1421 RepID=UPI003F7A20F5